MQAKTSTIADPKNNNLCRKDKAIAAVGQGQQTPSQQEQMSKSIVL